MSDVQVIFGADITRLIAATEGVKKQLEGLEEHVNKAGETFKRLGEIIGISLTVEGVKGFVEWMARLGEQTQRTAEIFGVSAEEVGFLRFEAEATGGSGDALVHTLEQMALKLQQATDKTNPLAIAFRALGLDAKAISQLPLPDILDKLREKFSQLGEGYQRTAIGQLLARNGAENLLPILAMNTEEWEHLRAAFQRTGAEMTGPQARAFAETEFKLTELRESVTGLAMRLFTVLKPAIDAVIDWMSRFIQSMDDQKIRNAAKGIVDWSVATIMAIGNLAIEIAGVVDVLISKLSKYGKQVEAFAGGAAIGAAGGALAGGVGAIPGALMGGFASLGISNIEDWFNGVNDVAEKGVIDTEALKQRYVAALKAFQEAADAYLDHPLTPSGDGDGDGKAKPGGGGSPLDLDFTTPHRDKTFTNALADAGKEASALRAQAAALNFSAGAAAAYTAEEKLRAVALSAGVKLTQADSVAIRAQAQAIGAATEKLQYAKAVQGQLQDLAQGITGAFMSWIEGTDSLGNAFLKLAGQIAAAVIEALILDAILSALGLAMPTQGFGAIFAPMFKPPSFDVGAWSIPHDTLAMVHQGETIVPKPFAEDLRAALSGGGSTGRGNAGGNTVHIHAMDAQGVAAFARRHAGALVDATQSYLTKNPSKRGKF